MFAGAAGPRWIGHSKKGAPHFGVPYYICYKTQFPKKRLYLQNTIMYRRRKSESLCESKPKMINFALPRVDGVTASGGVVL